MNEARQRFLRLLRRKQRCWQSGVLVCGGLRLLRSAVLLFAGYVLLDYVLAFSTPALLGLFSLVTLLAQRTAHGRLLPIRRAAIRSRPTRSAPWAIR